MRSTTPRTTLLRTSVASLAVVATLTLAGCSDDGDTSGMPMGNSSSMPMSSTAATPSASGTPAAGAHNQADVMFATMMIPHHHQAVEMSDLLLAKEDIPANITALAQKIKDEQSPEIAQMNGWLAGWGAPTGSSMDGDMDGMNHSTGDGMMSQADMDELKNATGTEAARLYLEGMTTHHEGAITMAQQELTDGQNADAKQLAQNIVTTQQAEIDQMKKLLAAL